MFLVLSGKKVKKGFEKEIQSKALGCLEMVSSSPVVGGRLEALSGGALIPLE